MKVVDMLGLEGGGRVRLAGRLSVLPSSPRAVMMMMLLLKLLMMITRIRIRIRI